MELWIRVFRQGILPQLGRHGLACLREALEEDSAELLQGATTDPPPVPACWDWECRAADPIAFALWQDGGLRTVGEVEQAFADLAAECDRLMGEPASLRWLLPFWDETPRELARRLLLEEVRRALAVEPAAA